MADDSDTTDTSASEGSAGATSGYGGKFHVPNFKGLEEVYESWKRKFQSYCYATGCWSAISTAESGIPDTSSSALGKKTRLFHLLTQAVEEESDIGQALLGVALGDGYGAWKVITSHFEDTTPARKRLVDQECTNLKQEEGESVDALLTRLNKLNRRRNLCGLQLYDDSRLASTILTAMLPVYNNKMDNVSAEVLEDLGQLRLTLKTHELTLKSRGELGSAGTSASTSKALAATTPSFVPGVRTPKPPVCWDCGGPHKRGDPSCTNRKEPKGRGPGRGGGGPKKGGRGAKPTKKPLGSNAGCHVCGKTDHYMKQCPHFKNAQAAAAASSSQLQVQQVQQPTQVATMQPMAPFGTFPANPAFFQPGVVPQQGSFPSAFMMQGAQQNQLSGPRRCFTLSLTGSMPWGWVHGTPEFTVSSLNATVVPRTFASPDDMINVQWPLDSGCVEVSVVKSTDDMISFREASGVVQGASAEHFPSITACGSVEGFYRSKDGTLTKFVFDAICVPELSVDRLLSTRWLAANMGAVIVQKATHTDIVFPDGSEILCSQGASGMNELCLRQHPLAYTVAPVQVSPTDQAFANGILPFDTFPSMPNRRALLSLDDVSLSLVFPASTGFSSEWKAQIAGRLWHDRLIHIGRGTIETLQRLGYGQDITLLPSFDSCDSCSSQKAKMTPYTSTGYSRSSHLLEVVHSDLNGPFPSSLGGNKYAVCFVDDRSRLKVVSFIKSKNETVDAFINFNGVVVPQLLRMLYYKKSPQPYKMSLSVVVINKPTPSPEVLQSDQGGEFQGKKFRDYCIASGIRQQFSNPYTQQQNGVAEAAWGVTLPSMRTVLAHANRGNKKLWGHALAHVFHIINCMPTRCADGTVIVPITAWSDVPIDYSALGVWGCDCYVTVPPALRTKLGPRAVKGIYLGKDPSSTGSNVLLPSGRVVTSGHIKLDELWRYKCGGNVTLHPPHPAGTTPDLLSSGLPTQSSQDGHNIFHDSEQDVVWSDLSDSEAVANLEAVAKPIPVDGEQGGGDDGDDGVNPQQEPQEEEEIATGTEEIPPALRNHNSGGVSEQRPPGTTRSGRVRGVSLATVCVVVMAAMVCVFEDTHTTADLSFLDDMDGEGVLRNPLEFASMVSLIQDVAGDPESVQEALSRPDANLWWQAMVDEYTGLWNFGTFALCDLPPGKKPLPYKWVFKDKWDHVLNRSAKKKARMTAKGCCQKQFVDYIDTYSPVCRLSTLRIVFAIACHYDYDIFQGDISQAFVQSFLQEDIYLRQPAEFDDDTGRVLKLVKSIYGLKQAGRNWYNLLRNTLEGLGFVVSLVDAGLFIMKDPGTLLITAVMLIWVDDLFFVPFTPGDGNGKPLWDWIVHNLRQHWEVTDLGVLTSALGMVITRDRVARTLVITVTSYIDKLVHRFSPSSIAGHAAKTPMKTDAVWHAEGVHGSDATPLNAEQTTDYRSLVSSMLYLVGCGRVDIAFACHCAARCLQTPIKLHMKQALRILSYLHSTRDVGLTFTGSEELNLELWVDASFAGEPQHPGKLASVNSRKSITGYALTLGGAAVSSKSKVQSVIATSSQHAEYMAAAAGLAEGTHLLNILFELGSKQIAITIMEDNNAAISAAENPVITDATKIVQVKYHYIRECVRSGRAVMNKVSTTEQHADVLTKALGDDSFVKHTRFLLGL